MLMGKVASKRVRCETSKDGRGETTLRAYKLVGVGFILTRITVRHEVCPYNLMRNDA